MTYGICHNNKQKNYSLLNKEIDGYRYFSGNGETYWSVVVITIMFLCFDVKGCRMGRSDKVSLWYVALLINTRFRFFFKFQNKKLLRAFNVTLRQRASK